ncbi:unnamed protein product [Leuciscus chuanchicus]
MFALGLLTCAVLTAFSAHAEVVDGFNGCKQFFYKNTEPGGMDQNAKTICQVYGRGQSMNSYYATLYSTRHRIPLYSAYVFDPRCESDSGRTDSWHVEPQISDYPKRNMVLERDLGNLELDKDRIKRSRAMSSDYSFTGYDRGHLNPSSFNCGDGRTATFTLTNAAPMVSCFNRGHWKNWELTLRRFLLNQLSSDGASATAYIVTGTVPNATLRIPQKKSSEEPERVTVPSHVWTAVCYKHHTDDSKSFSFGYMAENQPEQSGINPMSVSDLEYQLSTLYGQLSGTQQTVSIFGDACFGDNNKLDMVKEKFKTKIHMSTAVQTTYRGVKRVIGSDSQSSGNNVNVKEMSATLAFDSMNTFYTMTEDLKKEGGTPKPCCSSPCLYRHDLKSYRCNSGQTLIECSPRYSLVTANGERCKDDHPCAKYGYDYYWCYTVSGSWDYCSPPLRGTKAANGKYCRSDRACAKYGSSYMWCYTDDKGNYDKCCTSDDCRSAVNGQTCRSDHKCGYHGYSYLWCYTDYRNNWDYCCKDCAQFKLM